MLDFANKAAAGKGAARAGFIKGAYTIRLEDDQRWHIHSAPIDIIPAVELEQDAAPIIANDNAADAQTKSTIEELRARLARLNLELDLVLSLINELEPDASPSVRLSRASSVASEKRSIGAVAVCWNFLGVKNTMPRGEAVKALVALGVRENTARTQYQRWSKASAAERKVRAAKAEA